MSQGPLAGGLGSWGGGQWPAVSAPCHCVRGSKQELQGHPASLGCWESWECGGRGDRLPEVRGTAPSSNREPAIPSGEERQGGQPRQVLWVPLVPHQDLHPSLTLPLPSAPRSAHPGMEMRRWG